MWNVIVPWKLAKLDQPVHWSESDEILKYPVDNFKCRRNAVNDRGVETEAGIGAERGGGGEAGQDQGKHNCWGGGAGHDPGKH